MREAAEYSAASSLVSIKSLPFDIIMILPLCFVRPIAKEFADNKTGKSWACLVAFVGSFTHLYITCLLPGKLIISTRAGKG